MFRFMLVVVLLATAVPVWAQTCGNGVIDPGETCDPPNFAHDPLTGQVLCRIDCTSCGDGVVDAADQESCDAGPGAVCADCRRDCNDWILPGSGYGGCPCGLDDPAVADLRAEIVSSCACADAASRSAFVRCARAKLDAIAPNMLFPPCRVGSLKCLARSVCGKPGAVTCCQTNATGRQRCVIKADAAHCTAPKGGSAALGVSENCCDACP